jgi:hypothetical protein
MKPTFSTLKSNHYSSDPNSSSYKSGKDVYKEIGYDIDALVAQNAGYANTCATRMSLALIKSSVPFSGRLKIKDGKYKGQFVETGAKLLADQLKMPNVFGKPVIFYDMEKALKYLDSKRGIIFFWKLADSNGGHIDLIEPFNKTMVCNSACYFVCKEIWFWSLV